MNLLFTKSRWFRKKQWLSFSSILTSSNPRERKWKLSKVASRRWILGKGLLSIHSSFVSFLFFRFDEPDLIPLGCPSTYFCPFVRKLWRSQTYINFIFYSKNILYVSKYIFDLDGLRFINFYSTQETVFTIYRVSVTMLPKFHKCKPWTMVQKWRKYF